MKEITVYQPEISGEIYRDNKGYFHPGDFCLTREEAVELETAEKKYALKQAFTNAYGIASTEEIEQFIETVNQAHKNQ